MNKQKPIITWCVATMVLAGVTQVASARGGKEVTPLTAQGEKLQAKYAKMLADLEEEINRLEPKVDEKKKAEFTAHVCSVTVDRQFLLRVNRRVLVDVAIPYTKADWMDTEPVELELKEGRNRILYTQKTPNKGLSIRYFKLKPVGKQVSGVQVDRASAKLAKESGL